MTDEELRTLLLETLDYSYKIDEWVPPLAETLDGITAKQAAWRPAGNAKTIWEICLHVAVWNENIIERIETGAKSHPAQGNWPDPPTDLTEENWQIAKEWAIRSCEDLHRYLQTVPIEKIKASPWGLIDLTVRFSHISYHIGQIIKLREIKGW